MNPSSTCNAVQNTPLKDQSPAANDETPSTFAASAIISDNVQEAKQQT
jgi:hypothetical protein